MKNQKLEPKEKIMQYVELFHEFPIQIEEEFFARKKALIQAIESEPDPKVVKALSLFKLWLSKQFTQNPKIGEWRGNPKSWVE